MHPVPILRRTLTSLAVAAAIVCAAASSAEQPRDKQPAQVPSPVEAQSPVAAQSKSADTQVAGLDLDQTAKQLSDKNRTARLRAARTLLAFGPPAGPALATALGHDDAAVRYIALVGLGQLAGEPLRQAESKLKKLMTDDPSKSVRMAAAFARCRVTGDDATDDDAAHKEALRLLIECVQTPSRAMACSAAELLGMLGKDAVPAVDILTQLAKKHHAGGNGDYHIGGAAQKALRQIQTETR